MSAGFLQGTLLSSAFLSMEHLEIASLCTSFSLVVYTLDILYERFKARIKSQCRINAGLTRTGYILHSKNLLVLKQ